MKYLNKYGGRGLHISVSGGSVNAHVNGVMFYV